ncbi:2-iminobutanoate/2-iminopropanoate deaminase-like [Ixodes scapularis]|uniref:2-iminobutanoate/2-iminopropanoate deaminase-like n=1 Tax=Ixodes scapularis TaxID=6945 RepID=UPI001A9FE1A1|nr:2-iminobutanoate/2-iminopropanoate deaminase-like [Ixodes scapularis]
MHPLPFPLLLMFGVGVLLGIAADTTRQAIANQVPPKGPYSYGIRAGATTYSSASAGFYPNTTKLVPGGIAAETRQVLKNLQSTLEAGRMNFTNVVSTRVLLANWKDYDAMNQVYREFFPEDYPARSVAQVGLPAPGSLVEIEVVAVNG